MLGGSSWRSGKLDIGNCYYLEYCRDDSDEEQEGFLRHYMERLSLPPFLSESVVGCIPLLVRLFIKPLVSYRQPFP
jgi:hypothetical protein